MSRLATWIPSTGSQVLWACSGCGPSLVNLRSQRRDGSARSVNLYQSGGNGQSGPRPSARGRVTYAATNWPRHATSCPATSINARVRTRPEKSDDPRATRNPNPAVPGSAKLGFMDEKYGKRTVCAIGIETHRASIATTATFEWVRSARRVIMSHNPIAARTHHPIPQAYENRATAVVSAVREVNFGS